MISQLLSLKMIVYYYFKETIFYVSEEWLPYSFLKAKVETAHKYVNYQKFY